MKLYIKKNKYGNEIILGMATGKSEALKKLQDRADEFTEHIVKWYIYRDNDSQQHWKDEICNYLDYANRMKLHKHMKLTTADYTKTLFCHFQDCDENDAYNILWEFIQDVAKKNDYPVFKLTDDLCVKFARTLKLLKKNLITQLTSKNKCERKDFYNLIEISLKRSNFPDVEFL